MDELVSYLQQAQILYLVAHTNPDGDAVGSLCAWYEAGTQLGKECHVILQEGIPAPFQYLYHPEMSILPELPAAQPGSVCLVLDAPDSGRTTDPDCVRAYAKQHQLAYIDHHPEGDLARLADHRYHATEVSSTAELCFNLFQKLEVKFNPQLSLALLTGMYTDTGGFQLANTYSTTLEIAAELLRRGARLTTITQALNLHKTISSLRLLGVALEGVAVTSHDIALSVIGQTDFAKTGAHPDEITGIVGQVNTLPQAAAALLLVESEPGVIRGSLRSGPGERGRRVKVNQLARLLGGGGHPRAAGFEIAGKLTKNATGHWQITEESVR